MVTNEALDRLGRLLAARNLHYRLVVVGGIALRLRGIITRATEDVDIIAAVDPVTARLVPADRPLDPALLEIARLVANDMDLADDWLNSVVASQWDGAGLPPGMSDRLEWRTFGGLDLGIAGVQDLIALKLYAMVDKMRGDRRDLKHQRDLGALAPTEAQWQFARDWVLQQDASPDWSASVEEAIVHVRDHRG
jgi:hypothetical protein